jgi:hypothetical protein
MEALPPSSCLLDLDAAQQQEGQQLLPDRMGDTKPVLSLQPTPLKQGR